MINGNAKLLQQAGGLTVPIGRAVDCNRSHLFHFSKRCIVCRLNLHFLCIRKFARHAKRIAATEAWSGSPPHEVIACASNQHAEIALSA
jgi:hypothetical protein